MTSQRHLFLFPFPQNVTLVHTHASSKREWYFTERSTGQWSERCDAFNAFFALL